MQMTRLDARRRNQAQPRHLSQWDNDILSFFSEVHMAVEQTFREAIKMRGDAELLALRVACGNTSTINCGYHTYAAANDIYDIVENEILARGLR